MWVTMKQYVEKIQRMFKEALKDLALAIIVLFGILFVLIPLLNETPMRLVLGLLLALFMPGYSLIVVLFQGRGDRDEIKKIALCFGLSIAIVSLLGLTLNCTPFGIWIVPILGALSVFTVLLAVVAYLWRQWLPEGGRFVVEVEELA